MKNYLLGIFIVFSIPAYAQDSIKLSNRIQHNIKTWPNTNTVIAKWYAEENNGLLVTFPSLEKDKRIKIIEYVIVEKNGNALITKDSIRTNAFWIYPYSRTNSDNKQVRLELELWVRLNKKNVFYPVSKNGGEVFDDAGKVIYKNVEWQELDKSCTYSNGRYLLGMVVLGVNKKKYPISINISIE